MPPEPLPWDRKDFFKERKHERSLDSAGSVSRWRETPVHGRDFGRLGSADFRSIPPGHGKQGGWHLYSEESGHGFTPSRSNEKIIDDESFRLSGSRADGKYSRNGRENRGSGSQKDWKCHSWENGGSPNGPIRPLDLSDQRSVDDIITLNSHPPSNFVNTWDLDKTGGVNGLGTGQRFERENSLGSTEWKPLKWARSASMCSRGSGLSNSSSSKSMGVDSGEARAEAQLRNVTPVQSPSGEAVACATSAVAPSEETSTKKKPRLGWGEGLAKYEKKKVEGPDDIAAKSETGYCGRTEPLQSQVSNMADKSPRILRFSDCASPATPSSVACSSSPGVEDRPFLKATSIDNETSSLCVSPNLRSQSHLEGRDFNLENLDITPISNLSSSISELLRTDDLGPVSSSFVRSTLINKLLVWKGNVSKELEMTESEIESLETELKSLISESGSRPCPAASSSLLGECQAKPCEELVAASNLIPCPSPLQLDTSGDVIVEREGGGLEDKRSQLVDEDVDSPGTVTSKFVELLSSTNGADMSAPVTCGESSGDCDSSKSGDLQMKCSVHGSNEEKTGGASASEVDDQLIASKSSAPPRGGVSSRCHRDDKLYDQIVAFNKECANRASEALNKLLPYTTRSFCSWKSNPMIQEKFARRKRFLKFRERVITLKFRAFQHLWKEDMRLISLKKYRAKSQKRLELILRTQNGSYQKHRSSIRSRLTSPAGSSKLIPTTEVINFTSKLLSDLQVKPYRDSLKMPALILGEKEKKFSQFVSWNCLVEDPITVEKERAMINPWSSEEKEVFLDKLTTFGKDFKKIASFLRHKTTADCIEFYYKNHKSDAFEKTKKKPESGEQEKSYNYLATSGKRWNREINAASLDMLGMASAIAANADDGSENQQKCTPRFVLGLSCGCRAPRGNDVIERSCSLDRETAAADVLAGICGSLSSEAMSSCVTSSFDPVAVGSLLRRPLTPEVTQSVEDDTCSDESCGEMDHTDWTDEEKSVFIQAVSSYGKDFAMISRCMRTRSRDQCKVFFSKARKCLGLDRIGPRPSGDVGVVSNDNANGGDGSDNGSVVCNEKSSEPKIGEDRIVSDLNVNCYESDPAETMNVQTDLNRLEENNGRGQIDCKLENDVDGDNKMANGVDDEPGIVGPHKSANLPSDIEVQGREASGDDSSSGEKVETIAVGQDSTGSLMTEQDGQQLALEDDLKNEENENEDANLGGPADSNCSDQDLDVNVNVNAFDVAADANISVGFDVSPKQEQEISVELNSREEPLHINLEQEQDVSLVNAHSGAKGPSSLDFEVSEKQCVKPPSVDDYQHQSSHSQILMGYPIPTSTKVDTNGDISSKKVYFQSLSKGDRSFHSDPYLSQEYFLQKCNGSKTQSSVAELPFVPQQQKGNHSRAHSWSSSDTGKKPAGNGDVKLFGQILTHSSSGQAKQNSTGIHDNEDKGVQIQHPKLSSNSFNQKFTGTNDADASSTPKKFDQNNYRGLENVPIRSYGFWDGNRIQTGFSALPDSSLIMAKYPAAFGNYSTTSTNMEQQPPLHSVVKSNECSLNGVSVFSSSSNSGVAEYLLHRNREGARVQPFTVDLQPPAVAGRSVVGINVVGRGGGGILVGGVSDPVAAIKMHYAKTEHFNGQIPGVIREEESWRGSKKGDVGR